MSDGQLSDTAVVVIAGDVLWSELGSEHILLSLRDGTYYGLEEVGGEIWRLLQTPVPVTEICRALVEQYDVDPARCRRDVVKLLGDLVGRQLVEIRDPA
ncbi:MAG: PqqD family peptide modification chaperone [Vicinamibacterales bacterium]|nr:PqqD family peptide modification chaperone [Vicinamibacterales bacterium]